MDSDRRKNEPRRSVSSERKTLYYLGMALMVIGLVVFVSIFFSGFAMMSQDPFSPGYNPGAVFLRAPIGIGLILVGRLMMNSGARGLAGSGVVLDPEQAREDMEPWARMGGGMLRDALDEADVNLSGKGAGTSGAGTSGAGGEALTFDEKLRRLEDLRRDGLLTEAEYNQKRQEMLKKEW